MKQVLLMVHNTAGRSSNLVGLVKYLPEFNWQPVILAGAISQYTNLPARVVETPDQDALGFLRDLGRQMRDRFDMTPLKYPVGFLLSLAGEIINYPCPDKNWKRCGLEAAREILQKEEALRQKIEQPQKIFVKEIILPQGCLIPKEEIEQITSNFAGHWHSLKEIQEFLDILTQAYQKVYHGSKPPQTIYVIEEGKLIINFE